MKRFNQNMIASVFFAATFALTGCSVFGGQSGKPLEPSKDMPKDVVVKGDASSLSKDIAGEWVITAVGSNAIVRDEGMPYVTFEPSTGRFYGNNGCNAINGSYTVKGNDLTFGTVISTMRYCADVKFDTEINAVFADGVKVKALLKKIGSESYLYINDAAGNSLLTMVRHSMQFLNGQWQVVSINQKPVDDEECNVFFDINSMKIHGNTGCNFFNGSILIDPAVNGSISFSGMGVTRMACPKGNQERTMLVALEETVSAVPDGSDGALLIDGVGKPVLRLKRVQITR